jgi:hypothetical protein
MDSKIASRAPTVGVISRALGVPVHKVEYVIRARAIMPMAWAGNARIYSESDVQFIAAELRRIADEQEAGDE